MKAKTTSQLSRNALLISLPLLNWPLIIYLTGHPLSALGALIIALWIAGLIGPILNVAKRLYELQINAYNRQVASSQIQEIPDLTGWASYLPTVIMFSAIIGSGISWFRGARLRWGSRSLKHFGLQVSWQLLWLCSSKQLWFTLIWTIWVQQIFLLQPSEFQNLKCLVKDRTMFIKNFKLCTLVNSKITLIKIWLS